MENDRVTGRTRWRVFGLVLGAGLLGTGLMFAGLQQGALAASFAVSGTSYKATADNLSAQGVVQYGSVDQSANQAHPVLVNGFRKAKLDNFCQSILVPGIPVIGDLSIRINAPGGMAADNLVLGVQDVTGDLTLNNVEIGRDAGSLTKGPSQGPGGAFGIQADSMNLAHVKQTAWSTTASTLRLNQVHISATPGRNECF